jgi:hypothetical protein
MGLLLNDKLTPYVLRVVQTPFVRPVSFLKRIDIVSYLLWQYFEPV